MIKTISFLFYGFILVDMVSGELLMLGLPSISLFYKIFVMSLIVFYLLKNGEHLSVLFVFVIFVFYINIHFIISGDISLGFGSVDWIAKFAFIYLSFLFFSTVSRKVDNTFIFKFAKYSFIFLILNFMSGLFGFGYSMYGSGDTSIGVRGFIYAGNEISATIVISSAILLIKAISEKNYSQYLIISFFMFFMAALLTSKLGIGFSLIIFLFLPLIATYDKISTLRVIRKDFYFSTTLIVVVPFIAFGAIYYILYEQNLIARLSFFYEKMDLITLLFSSRNIWALEAFEHFYNNYQLMEVFFGTGYEWTKFISADKHTEIDFTDFLMTFGILGIILSYGFLIHLIVTNIKNKYVKYNIFMIILIILMSLTGGHILNSGVAGGLIGALLALKSSYKKEEIQ